MTGVLCSTGAEGPYFCSHDATLRLVGVIGTPFGAGFEGFLSGGLVIVDGKSATTPFTVANNRNYGLTGGVGLQRDVGQGKIRFEITYDKANNAFNNPPNLVSGSPSFEPSYEATSARLSYVINFN